ncbi:MAG: hypothetical protein Q4D10_07630 [Bacteroidales bacterium]|nr:hypothetical protein [Bacteroidales bacterium]
MLLAASFAILRGKPTIIILRNKCSRSNGHRTGCGNNLGNG